MSDKIVLSVIAPCYNESKNVVELSERLQKVFVRENIVGEVVLINDGSTDDTSNLLASLAQRNNNIITIHHKKNRGMVNSWKIGIDKARGIFVCLIDADLQNLPEDVGRLYQEINFSHADVVQGWRNHIGKLQGGKLRHWSSRGLNFILNLFFSMHSKDNKSGFIICRKEVLSDILTYKYNYRYYQTFIAVAAKYKGYYIREIETLFQNRHLGKSFITNIWKVSFMTFVDIVKAFVEFRIFSNYDNSLEKYLSINPPIKENKPLPFWRNLYFKLYIILFPLHHWMISYDAYKYYKVFERSQWLPKNKIKEFQEAKLRQLIIHAYCHVSFYRELFKKNNIKPENIKTIEDLCKLPVIDKYVVRDNLYAGMMSDNHDKSKIQKVQTSGSTGEPLVTYAEKKQLDMRWAATQRSFEWTGYRFGDRQVRLWHKYLGMKSVEIFKEMFDAFLSRRKFIPAYEIKDKNLHDYVNSIMVFKPVLLDGYAESFNFLARYLKNNKYNGHKPKGIMSSAQTLPPESRKIIEETFGCGVFDKYGAREFAGGVAYQCEHRNGYHVVAECNIVEIIKDGRQALPGEIGEIIITELNNYVMPLIRYRVGDLAVVRDQDENCKCGRGLPKIGEIQGRTQSIVVGTGKQFIPGTFFNRVFFKHDLAIKQYQVVQEKFGELIIKIIKGNLFNEEILASIFKDIKSHMGEDLIIKVLYVDEIPLGRTGKRQYCISLLDPFEVVKNLEKINL